MARRPSTVLSARRGVLVAWLVATGACGGGDTGADAATSDGGATSLDAPAFDGAAMDARDGDAAQGDARVSDADPGGGTDAWPADALALDGPWGDAMGADAAPADAGHVIEHVHIYIDNFCNVSTSPTEIVVPSGGSVNISWHNHSVDYEADVWMSYGGGYLELARGGTWNESFTWCAGIAVFTGTADIGPAGVSNSVCPHVYFPIRCL